MDKILKNKLLLIIEQCEETVQATIEQAFKEGYMTGYQSATPKPWSAVSMHDAWFKSRAYKEIE